jgi:hypothetical protein
VKREEKCPRVDLESPHNLITVVRWPDSGLQDSKIALKIYLRLKKSEAEKMSGLESGPIPNFIMAA